MTKRTLTKKQMNEAKKVVANGLAEAVFGGGPFNPNQSIGVQLSQVTTIFKNNRWYLISNMRQVLNEVYVEHGLIQTVIDVPVDDGMRGGVTINSKLLSEEEIMELSTVVEREDDMGKMAQALKWNRLFGGAGVLVVTDQDWTKPLNIAELTDNENLAFRAVDMWELFWDQQNTEGFNPAKQTEEFEFYSYYGKKIHKSRVLTLKGKTAPSFIRPRLRGWGFSIIESLVRSINQYLKATDLLFEVLDEFKVDAYKIKNLANTLLKPGGTEQIARRIQIANQQKNYQNAIVMDSEDDFIQKILSFSGLAETMQQIRLQVACDLRMPLSKIFGIAATGFSSGEDDIENYNSMVESQIRAKSKYHILSMLELRCQQLFGYVPDDLSIEFKPLRILSAEQEENCKTQSFNRVLSAKTAGELTTKEFRDACNKENLLPIQLDTDIDEMELGVRDDDNDPDTKQPSPTKEKDQTKLKAKEAKT